MAIVFAFGIDVVLPAFDNIRGDFDLGSGSGEVAPVVIWYLVGSGVGQLIHGSASDRFGRKPVIYVGLAIYVGACLGALFAPTIGLLFGARFVWGLGSAAMGVLYTTIARDLYDGDEMARVVSIVVAFFLLGPIITPLLGELMIRVFPWRSVIVAAIGMAMVLFFWTLRFPETLSKEDRRPLKPRATLATFGYIVRHRATMSYILALTSLSGAFFIFLASSQPIIDEIYGRGDQFAVWFAISSIPTIAALFISQRLVKTVGARRLVFRSGIAMVFICAAWIVVSELADGTPSFGWWFGLLVVVNSLATVQTPLYTSLALEPMGDKAGSASSLLGFFSLAGGAVLATIFNNQIDLSVTPMAIGYTLYGSASLIFFWFARPNLSTSSQITAAATASASGSGVAGS
ncbi:MAG: multidrug effflux MFS transporter [Actinobacteria bacterium]|nr:multidrug effflux MFS transporter [Actinomycetota bacterium]